MIQSLYTTNFIVTFHMGDYKKHVGKQHTFSWEGMSKLLIYTVCQCLLQIRFLCHDNFTTVNLRNADKKIKPVVP